MKNIQQKYLIPLLFFILGLFMIRSVYFNPWLSISTCLQNPEKYHNCYITRLQEPRILSIERDGFILGQKQVPSIKVISDTTGLRINEFVGLTSRFHKDGYLIAEKVEIAYDRREKIWLSTLPFFLIVFLFFRYFKFNIKRFCFELRIHA